MKATKKHINRFREKLKEYQRLKKAGKLNGKAMSIKSKLKSFAKKIGLNFDEELNGKTKKRSNPAESVHDIVVHAQRLQNFGHDISEDLQKLDEKVGADGWKWNKKKTKIILLKEENQNHDSDSRENPCSCETRENPVKVPFSVTLKEIYDMHKFRSWKRLNSMLGSVAPCYARKPWESTTAHLSVIYVPDYYKKVYNLDLLIDGHLEGRYCSKGSSGGFKKSLKKLVDDWGDLEVVIYDQGHAKKVLGAKRYKKQERAYAKKQNASKTAKKKSSKTAKKAAIGNSWNGYITHPAGSKLLPVDKIKPRGEKVSNAKLKRAKTKMRQAKTGNKSKRKPITVKMLPPDEDYSYQIIDGNTTLTIAKQSGWENIPAIVQNAKKEAKKSKPAPKYETGDLLYLTEPVGRHEAGTQVKVRHDFYPAHDDNVSVRCCEGEMVKEAFQVPVAKLSKTSAKKTAESPQKHAETAQNAAEGKQKEQSDPDLDAIEASQNKIDNFLDSLLQA